MCINFLVVLFLKYSLIISNLSTLSSYYGFVFSVLPAVASIKWHFFNTLSLSIWCTYIITVFIGMHTPCSPPIWPPLLHYLPFYIFFWLQTHISFCIFILFVKFSIIPFRPFWYSSTTVFFLYALFVIFTSGN